MTVLKRPEGPSPDDMILSRRAALGAGAAGGLFFAGYAPAALSQAAQPITTDAEGLIEAEATLSPPDGFDLPAYVVRPDGEGPFPTVIVASEIFGVHAYIRDLSRRLAKAGYAVIAPAFFVRVEDPAPLTDFSRIMPIVAQAGYEQVMGDVGAAIDWARAQDWASDRFGITGFCWGGKVVWQAAARFDALSAGVAWYGRLAPAETAAPEQVRQGRPWPIDLAANLKAPVLGRYGGRDDGIPVASVEAMTAALKQAGKTDSRIILYPDAPHGFHADYRASYRPADAADGWAQMLALFDRTLKQG